MATLRRPVNLLAGRSQVLAVRVRPTPILAGDYTLLAAVTDPAGTVTTTAGPALTIAAPVVHLTATVAAAPTAVTPGRPVILTLTLANTGNTDAVGLTSISVGLSVDGNQITIPIRDFARPFRLRGNGRPIRLRFRGVIPAGTTPMLYQPFATIVQNDQTATAVGDPITVGTA